VRVVAEVLHLDLVLEQVVVAVVVELREVVEAAAEVAEELVPAEPGRAEPGQVAAVPLADQRGVVALALEQRGERRVGNRRTTPSSRS